MSQDLEELQRILIEGQRRSMQGSYQRRSPAKPAIPFLLEARSGLKTYVEVNGQDAKAWRSLSQAEECLLNYSAALDCLERAMNLSGQRDKKDLRRLALLKEYEADWKDLNLTPAQLQALGDHLNQKLLEEGCDHTLRCTQEWLKALSIAKPKSVMDALRNRGGYCDCEVLNNVVSR